jgi:hypothetical protein
MTKDKRLTERMTEWKKYGEPEEFLARKATVEEIIEKFT